MTFSPQGWDAAGAKDNQDDKNYLNWALALIRDLFFPGKKPKEIIEQGGDDSIKDDLDSGGKKDEGDVKVIFVSFPLKLGPMSSSKTSTRKLEGCHRVNLHLGTDHCLVGHSQRKTQLLQNA